MTAQEKSRAVELIRHIQGAGGTPEDFDELERLTGNSNFWYILNILELEGFLPEKILSLFCRYNEMPVPQQLNFNIPGSSRF